MCAEGLHVRRADPRYSMPSNMRPRTGAGILQRLLYVQLGFPWSQVGDVGSFVMRGDLERQAGPRRGLLEDQRDIATGEPARREPPPFLGPQPAAELDQVQETREGYDRPPSAGCARKAVTSVPRSIPSSLSADRPSRLPVAASGAWASLTPQPPCVPAASLPPVHAAARGFRCHRHSSHCTLADGGPVIFAAFIGP